MGMVREERELKGQVLEFPVLGGELVLLTNLLTPSMQGFPTPTTRFPYTNWVSTIQLNDGTNYLELASNLTGLKAQSYETALTSEASHKY